VRETPEGGSETNISSKRGFSWPLSALNKRTLSAPGKCTLFAFCTDAFLLFESVCAIFVIVIENFETWSEFSAPYGQVFSFTLHLGILPLNTLHRSGCLDGNSVMF